MDLSTDGLVDGTMVEDGLSEGSDEDGIDFAATAGIDRDSGDGKAGRDEGDGIDSDHGGTLISYMVMDDSSSDGSDGKDDGGSSESLLKHADGGDKAQTVDLDKAGSSLLPHSPTLSTLRNMSPATFEAIINDKIVGLGNSSPPISIDLSLPKGQKLNYVLNQGGYETLFNENVLSSKHPMLDEVNLDHPMLDKVNIVPEYVNPSPCAFNIPHVDPVTLTPHPSIFGPKPISSSSLLGPSLSILRIRIRPSIRSMSPVLVLRI
ncbi:hypothetical protein L2E82_30220 [Cichorium intybus]|uniref:Uncharacterized protein n=1 Tax=Cichorium intybus TaxID=13427 RepID=A0ACB9CZL9_CICIN|nr:hypothetical protein L2E82_30220 [Cichorium intybus]